MNSKIEIHRYDLRTYNFPKIISDLIDMGDLDEITAEFEGERPEDDSSIYKNMERSKAYSRMYSALASEEGLKFYETFDRFIRDIIRPHYRDSIYYQKKPTHRILYADVSGVSRFHRDRDYGHNVEEINFFVPLTKAFGTNTLWLESADGKEDFKPMELIPGEFLRFDGANLKHGAKVNTTGKTRVSFDFRILPMAFAKGERGKLMQSGTEPVELEGKLAANPHLFALAK